MLIVRSIAQNAALSKQYCAARKRSAAPQATPGVRFGARAWLQSIFPV
jgi:hypothetical protein